MISICMITKNEEAFLANALESVKDLVQEIIVVDTGSMDKTLEIAKKYNARVFNFKWVDNFSTARNYSLEQAREPWILVLDADETISKEDCETIKKLIQNASNDIRAISIIQYNYTNDKNSANFIQLEKPYMNFSGYVPAEIVRIFRNDPKIRFEGAVHETVKESISRIGGKLIRTDIPIHHFQFIKGNVKEKQLKYLEIYEKNIDSYPNKAKAYRDIAAIYFNFKEDYEKAIGYFEKSKELDPKHVTTYIGLGWCYLKSNDYEKAIDTFIEALKLEKSFTVFRSLGYAHLFSKDYEKALKYFKLALKLNPKSEEIKNITEEITTPNYSFNLEVG